ncbi:MAG: response regulator transcription factor [Cyanobacteria bacterium K_DeepCast_35m_m2_023]|nr:response regulator transcription factor [Cyanobacteria bacterium K_DeepCast_35m_m2_023]
MGPVLRCLIVEDQVMFLELLQRLLEGLPGLEVVATAGSAATGSAACRLHRPDLLVLDLSLSDGDGLPVLASLAQWCPAARAVVLSAQAAGFVCPEPLQAQLLGVVDKAATYETLVDVIRDLLPRPSALGSGQALTPAQQRIYALIGQGLSNKQIAQQLDLSVATVETHRKAISRRLGLSGAELVRHAALQNRS